MRIARLAWAAAIAAAMVAGSARGADSSKSLKIMPGPGAGATSSSSLALGQAAKTATISEADIAAGDVVVPCAVWLVEGTADTESIRFEFTINTSNGDARYVRFAAVEPGAEYFSQPLSYSLADGTSFDSRTLVGFAGTGERKQDEWRFRPSGTMSLSCEESNAAHGTANAWCSLAWIAPAGGGGFRWSGARSDSYPLCLVLFTFAKGTPAGAYSIEFIDRQDSDSSGRSCFLEANGQKYDTKNGNLILTAMEIVIEGASAPAAPVATVVTSAVSRATFRLDTREGPFESDGTETLTYSTLWHGTADSSVTILANGETVVQGLSGESDYVWRAVFNGTNVLRHVTDGPIVLGDNEDEYEPETAVFVVKGLYPDPSATLRWKYAKNANGWFCAQVAFPWHPGYAAALSNMRLLFADRFEDEEPLVVIETLDDEQTAYFQTDRMVKMVGQEDGRNYYLKLEDGDVFSEAFLRNGYKEHLGDPETKPDNYLDGMEASSLSDFGSTLGADDFWNEDGVLNNSGTSYSPMVTVDGRGITLRFAAARRGLGRTTAYLVDPATVAAPLGSTETYRDVEYRAAPIDLDDFSNLAGGERAVFGVSDETMDSPLASVPAAERKICLRVANRQLQTVGFVQNKVAWLAWEEGGRTNFLPLVGSWTSAEASSGGAGSPAGGAGEQSEPEGVIQHSAFSIQHSVLSAPLSPGELNTAASFGLPPAAVAKAKVTCRISTTEIGTDGVVTGTFEIAAGDAGRVVAESGEISEGVKFTILGAASLGDSFEPLDPDACGVELISRRAPYAFRVKAPGDNAFFKVLLAAEERYE